MRLHRGVSLLAAAALTAAAAPSAYAFDNRRQSATASPFRQSPRSIQQARPTGS